MESFVCGSDFRKLIVLSIASHQRKRKKTNRSSVKNMVCLLCVASNVRNCVALTFFPPMFDVIVVHNRVHGIRFESTHRVQNGGKTKT